MKAHSKGSRRRSCRLRWLPDSWMVWVAESLRFVVRSTDGRRLRAASHCEACAGDACELVKVAGFDVERYVGNEGVLFCDVSAGQLCGSVAEDADVESAEVADCFGFVFESHIGDDVSCFGIFVDLLDG